MDQIIQVNYYIKKGSNWLAKNGREYLRWGWFPFVWILTAYWLKMPVFSVIASTFLPTGLVLEVPNQGPQAAQQQQQQSMIEEENFDDQE